MVLCPHSVEKGKRCYKVFKHEYLNATVRIVGFSFLIYTEISLNLIIEVHPLCPKEQNAFTT